MALSASFANHLAPGLRDIIGTTFAKYEAMYSRFFNVETSQGADEKYLHATGLPFAIARGEGEPTPFFDPLEGTTKTFTHDEYAIGVMISKEAWDDDRYKTKSALRTAANGLTRAMTERVERIAADLYNSAYAAANTAHGILQYNTVDGVSFWNTQHRRLIGASGTYEATGTIANRLASGADFSVTTLRSTLATIKKWTDDRGYLMRFNPVRVIVPVDIEYPVKEVFASTDRPYDTVAGDYGGAHTGNRAINVHHNQLAIEVWPYLTNVDDWFVQCSEHYAMMLWRERPTLDSWDDKNTRTAKHASYMRFSLGALHYLGNFAALD